MKKKEIRTLCAEVRASPQDDGKGLKFAGYAARFNEWSEDLGGFRERIAPGAFRRSIGVDDVRALFNHDPNYVLGRNGAGTLRLSEDEHGLAFEIDGPDTSWTRDLHTSVERGDISQCSFAFEVEAEEWARREWDGHMLDERTLKEVRLYDISIVTYPAYEGTSVSARSAGGKAGEGIKARKMRLSLKEKEWGK